MSGSGPGQPDRGESYGSLALDITPRLEDVSPRATPVWRLAQQSMALAALLLLSPALLALWVAVKATSKGPFLFRQERSGLGGKPFTVYKIRTLYTGNEAKTALGTDRRSSSVTPIGRLLRELKVDELPQLINIVRGEMEFVGPRPIPIKLEEELSKHIPGFHQRTKVAPGLSNLAQVSVADNALGDRLVEDWSTRFEAELHYIQRKSFWYDLTIVAMTAMFVIRRAVRRALCVQVEPHQNESRSTIVLGVPISNLDYEGVIGYFRDWIDAGARRYVCVCPVHNVVESRNSKQHAEVLRGASLNTSDGMPIVWARRLLGDPGATRVYGPTLMLEACQRAEIEGWRIALYGGHPDRLPVLVEKLTERYPGLNIVEAISPPFGPVDEQLDAELTQRLIDAQPDIVWVGLGCPKQERWMHEHVGRVPGVLVGVGAAFDFHAGFVRQAPPVLQRFGLEWAFRLVCEPKRLWKRYATTNPHFVFCFARQLVGRFLLAQNYQRMPTTPPPPVERPRVSEAA